MQTDNNTNDKLAYKMKYKIEKVNPSNEALRKAFNSLIKATFGFDFEQWYQNGDWSEDYVPYVLLDDNAVIANVSVSFQSFKVGEEIKSFAQLGAVATDKKYRGQGLSRHLLEHVLNDLKNCDQVHLYANNNVRTFYPKFNFIETQETQYYIQKPEISKDVHSLRKLDLSKEKDLSLLKEKASESNPFSGFSLQNASSLIMFYVTYFMQNNVFYSEKLDLIFIANMPSVLEREFTVKEILGHSNRSLGEIIAMVTPPKTKEVILEFTPKDKTGFKPHPFKESDSTLFILNPDCDVTKEQQCMFPVLSHT